MKKFIFSKGPYLRNVDHTNAKTSTIMRNLLIAMIPIILFGFIFNGVIPFVKHQISVYYMLKPLINVLVGGLSSFIFEAAYSYFILKKKHFSELCYFVRESFAIIPGLILVLTLPVYTDLYIIVIGCFIANIVYKMLFGGLGHNIFNPALIAYAFCYVAFAQQLSLSLIEHSSIMDSTLNITTTATPISLLSNLDSLTYDKVQGIGGLLKLFFGFKVGSLGEVSCLLCIVAFIYLLITRVIDWIVPATFVGSVFVIAWIIGIIMKKEGPLFGIWFPTYNILTGGLLFGAVFIATEPVTTPCTPNGKVIFGLLLGLLTSMVRFIMGIEGVATAILFISLFTPIIDNFSATIRSSNFKSKYTAGYLLLFLIYALGIFYIIYKIQNKGMVL